MPLIYADASDGFISASGSSYTTARHASSGTLNSTAGAGAYAVRAASLSGRGGGLTYRFARSFFYFDVSSISDCTSVTLNLSGYSSAGSGGGIVIMASTAFGGDGGTALAAGDYDLIKSWDGSSDMTGATKFSSAPAVNMAGWNVNHNNIIPLGSAAETSINNLDYLIICVVDYTYDYLKAEPVTGGASPGLALANNVGLFFSNYSGTSRDPYLNITLSGYGHDVNGVAAANIGKVNSVATANIGKINSVD
tara:strand:+ start:1426 stop:2178 length:753 start_codon:yes stop_codon:yes gene_type:complete